MMSKNTCFNTSRLLKSLFAVCIAMCAFVSADAQRLAIKTNTIDWLTMNGEIGIEARLSRRLTLDIGVVGNPFNLTVSGIKLNTLRFQPELRYWFNRPMARHFMGFALLGGTYDLKLRSHMFEGDIFAAGLTYGYALVLNSHWNMEAEIGVGLGYLRAFKYRDWEQKPDAPNFHKWTPVPIRIGLSFAYIFDSVPEKKR